MASRRAIGAAAVAAVAAAAVAAAALGGQPQGQEWGGPESERMHGAVSTAYGSPVYGDPEAPITIVEFGDYQCHQCYNWFHNTRPILYEEYVDTGIANVVFVDMAFLGRDSRPAAEATYCAEDQGAYWGYHDKLYESQGRRIDDGWASRDMLKGYAADLGLDGEEFAACLDAGKYRGRVQQNVDEASRYGVEGTPTFHIASSDGGSQRLVGAQPYAAFKRALDSLI